MPVRRAFTLIELLVVVSIIALMIALLLPALGSSRESARMAQCMSNLRQLGEGWHAYSTEHDGFLPVADNNVSDQSWVRWVTPGVSEHLDDLKAGSLWGYLRDADIYRCPGEDRVASDGQPYIRSYAITAYLNGNYNGRSFGQNKATSTDGILRPDETILMLDEADTRNRIRGSFQVKARGTPNGEWQWVDWPAHFHFDGFPHSFADGSVVFRRYEDGRTKTIDRFHVKHVGSLDWAYVADRFDPGQPNNP